MRVAVAAVVLISSFVGLCLAANPPADNSSDEKITSESFGSSNDMIALSWPGASGERQLAVLDTKQRVISVYQIDPSSGEITLNSVRNITWDLQLVEFNGVSPLPKEIRLRLEQR